MQVIKPMSLGVSARPLETGGRFGLCVSAYMYMPFARTDHTLWSEASMWQFLATAMPEPLIDEGVVKTTAEYLVHGCAYPPAGQQQGCAVRAQVAGLDKTLLVHGDRMWQGRQPSAALPFQSMPIGWTHAFGGEGHPENPLGRGLHKQLMHGAEAVWLPNIESPSEPIHSPEQRPRPAGFGRIDPTWASRARFRGTYDDNWLQQHAPGYPPDLNWKYFNFAPEDQWFTGAIPPDAGFKFQHLHPTEAVLEGALPNFAIRLIARFNKGEGERFKEIPNRLSTLWFFPEAKALVAIAQGLLEVQEDDASDVNLLMAGVERVGEEKPREHYLQVLQRRSDPEMGAIHSMNDADLLPAGLPMTDPMLEDASKARGLEGFVADNQFRGAQAKVQALREKLLAIGQDPDRLGVKVPVREKPPTLQELPAYLQQLMSGATKLQAETLKQTAADLEKVQRLAAANQIALDDLVHRGPPKFSAFDEIAKVKQALGPDADPAQIARIEKKMAQAHGAVLMGYWQSAHLQPPALPMSAEASKQHADALLALQGRGKSLSASQLTGAQLGAIKLPKADLSCAQMESVNAQEADFRGADIRHAVLAHAQLARARFDQANMEAVNLGKANLEETSFEASNLTGAILSGAKLKQTNFHQAALNGARVDDAEFERTRMTECGASQLNFIKTRFVGVDFSSARLAACTFIECEFIDCQMEQACFDGSSFMKCTFTGVRAHSASFEQATFDPGCVFEQLDAAGANFSRACMRGIRAAHSTLQNINAEQTDLSGADLVGSKLNGARLRQALLIRTALGGVALERADLSHAVLQNADIRATLFIGTNLYGADLSRVRRDRNTLFQDANVDRAKIRPLRKVSA